eukprot:g16530.t1
MDALHPPLSTMGLAWHRTPRNISRDSCLTIGQREASCGGGAKATGIPQQSGRRSGQTGVEGGGTSYGYATLWPNTSMEAVLDIGGYREAADLRFRTSSWSSSQQSGCGISGRSFCA